MQELAELMMPFSNVAHLPFEDKLRATRDAGCRKLSLMPFEVERLVASGRTSRDLQTLASDYNVAITRLDPLNTWSRIWRPDNMEDAYIATVDTDQDTFFALSSALGCTNMSLNATFPPGALSQDEIKEDYAAICRRAAEHGLSCDLEFIPLWGLPTLEQAWNIVSDVGESNAGLVFDTWHFVRGGSSLKSLERIPADKIRCIQLNDGPLKLPPGRTIKDDCYDRKFPGEGEFPNAEVLRIISANGPLHDLSVEVFSPRLAAMSAEEVARVTRHSLQGVLREAALAN